MLLLRVGIMTTALLVAGSALAAGSGRSNPAELRAMEVALKQQQTQQTAPVAILATVSYSATNVGGAEWARPFADCTGTSALGPVRYHSQVFSVSVTGTYALTSVQTGWDGFIFVYQNTFDPAQPNINCLAGNDDGGGGIGTSDIPSANLTAGTTYYLVTTAFELGEEGPFENTIDGPGDITLVAAGPSADLGLTKAAPDGVVNGGSYAYVLTASNAGPDDATGVSVIDPLPAGVSFVSSSCGATAAGQTVTWDIGGLANAVHASCTLTVARASLTCDAVTNTATISGAEADPVSANNTATHSNGGGEQVIDGGFEVANAPAWAQTSTNFGSPLCNATCGTGGGTAGPRSGAQWMWFGGGGANLETASAQQAIVIPVGANELEFGYWLGVCGAGGANDFIRLTVGGTEVWRRDATSAECGAAGYTLANVDISAFATGASHVVRFESTSGTAGNNSNFHIDDVSIPSAPVCTESPDADLSLSQALTAPGGQTLGATVEIALDVENLGPGAANGAVVTSTLSSQLTFASSTCGATAAGQIVSWPIGALANGASAVCTLSTTIGTAGGITVSSEVTSTSTDPVASNNIASDTLAGAPVPTPNIGIVGSGSLSFTAPGEQCLVLNNAGDGAGDVPAPTFTGPFGLGTGTCGATPICTPFPYTLGPGASCAIPVAFTATAPGNYPGNIAIGPSLAAALTGTIPQGPVVPTMVPVNSAWTLALMMALMGLVAGVMIRQRS